MFGKRNISYNKNTRQSMLWQIFQPSLLLLTHIHTHPSPRAPFPPLILPILPPSTLPPLIKGHLLSFLSASPGFSSPSLIGGFLQICDWPVLSAPPLVNSHEDTSSFLGGHSFFLLRRPPARTLRLLLGAPPLLQTEKKSV